MAVTARIRIERAKEALRSAQLLLAEGQYVSACDRAYYAAFHAARAALASVDQDNARTHAGVHTQLSKHFVLTGKLPVELLGDLKRNEASRLAADYGDVALTQGDAAAAVAVSVKIIHAVQQLLEAANPPDYP